MGEGRERKSERMNIPNMECLHNLYMAAKVSHFLSSLLTQRSERGRGEGSVAPPQIWKCVFSIECSRRLLGMKSLSSDPGES